MKLKYLPLYLILFIVSAASAQRKRKPNAVDTILSNYQPAEVFSPMFYPDRGDDIHAPNGEPGPKYWQNRVNYHIKASIDTTNQTLTATETIDYINNSPAALQYLWLQLDQNTYKKDARSNFYTDFTDGAHPHTEGYQIESVAVSYGDVLKKVDFVIVDTVCRCA